MKLLARLLFSCLLVVPLAAQDPYQKFVKAFTECLKFDNTKKLDRAVRSSAAYALNHYEFLCQSWVNREKPEDLRKQLDFLGASFKRTFDSGVAGHVDRYWQRVDKDSAMAFNKLSSEFDKSHTLWQQAQQAGRDSQIKLIDDLRTAARRFEELGHAVMAGKCWASSATYTGMLPNKTVADQRDQLFSANQCLASWKRWEWHTNPVAVQWTSFAKAKKKELQAAVAEAKKRKDAGFKKEVVGPDKYLVPDAKEIEQPLTFEMLKQPIDDHTFRGGTIPPLWNSVQIRKDDKGITDMAWFRKRKIYMVRPAANKFGISLEAKLAKNNWLRIHAASKLKPTKFYLDKDKKEPYAMWFYTAGSSEPVFGTTSNLAPGKDYAEVYYLSASSWKTEVDGVKLRFFDDNSNGELLEEDPFKQEWKERSLGFGPKKEVPVPTYDSMSIGKAKPVPFSAWAKINEKWYHLRGKSGGTRVGVRPCHMDFLKIGSAQLNWTGPKGSKPQSLILRGSDAFASAAFDLAGGKPVEMPVGKYTLVYGRISKGKKARTMQAQILQGDSKEIEVKEGETTVVELGAPFTIDFVRNDSKLELELDSLNFQVKGKAGELYCRVNGAVPAPDVLLSKDGVEKGAKVIATYVPITSGELLNTAMETVRAKDDQIGLHVGFFPVVKGDKKVDTKLKMILPKPGKIGLRQKKNKLFGTLQPTFK